MSLQSAEGALGEFSAVGSEPATEEVYEIDSCGVSLTTDELSLMLTTLYCLCLAATGGPMFVIPAVSLRLMFLGTPSIRM